MKKIYKLFIFCVVCLCGFSGVFASNEDCKLMKETKDKNNVIHSKMVEGNLSDIVEWCLKDTGVYIPKWDAKIEGNLKGIIVGWTQTIAVFLGFLSVFWIVLGSLFLTLSWGEDDKVNKGKNIIKWSIIWLLAVMFAGTVVVMVVNIMYGV